MDCAERRLVALMCATAARRQSRAHDAAELLSSADPGRMIDLLRRLHLTVLVGQRLIDAGLDLGPQLREEVEVATALSGQRGGAHELITHAILDTLESAGIRALALKGSVLARALYGDVAWRSAGDIDILVAPADLAGAIEAVEGMDWRWQRANDRGGRLPVLHETLTHPTMPRVELHWRVHWYEDRFAADALERAETPAVRAPLQMLPADGLATLTLIYARDGLSGLRTPADIAAWWDTRCDREDLDASIGSIAGDYPALEAPLRVGTAVLGPLVGLPTHPRQKPFRWQVAAELANPFHEGGHAQSHSIGVVWATALNSSNRRRVRSPSCGSDTAYGSRSRLEALIGTHRAGSPGARWTITIADSCPGACGLVSSRTHRSSPNCARVTASGGAPFCDPGTFMSGGPGYARTAPLGSPSATTSSANRTAPRLIHSNARLVLPPPMPLTNATTPSSVSTALACNSSYPRSKPTVQRIVSMSTRCHARSPSPGAAQRSTRRSEDR